MRAQKQIPRPKADTSEQQPAVGDRGSSMKDAPVKETDMMSCFAVFPDGAATPAAVFADLEDAMDWGLQHYGCDAFGIRHFEMAQVERAERHGAPGPA